ncbi:MAG: DUF6270 domain-containing protein [Propionibacteriaceae bacterium]|nr:DUF6270 domain-containing protein [Propionibacteriaceae bacterium]
MTQSAERPGVRVALWGSCVTRDLMEIMPARYRVARYIARQSWISAGSNATGAVGDLGQLGGRFQTRMAHDDVAGSALSELRAVLASNSADCLVLDLCDERLGVVRMPDGSFVTRSVEKMRHGVQDSLDSKGEVIPFATLAHLNLWIERAEAVVAALQQAGLTGRAFVLAPDWALVDDKGKTTPASFGLSAPCANQWFERYYDVLAQLGLPVLRFTEVVADTEHRWGLAAFHYDRASSDSMAEALDSALSGIL